tara:strand:+ start:13501 stop:15441 length:1941 start_codon:yes stop_codon:yes gene_type:complete
MNGGDVIMAGDTNEMYPHQKDCIDKINDNYQNHVNSILKLPTGTGKTRISIEHIKKCLKKGKKIIVVAPSRFVLSNVWINEIKKWGVEKGNFVQMDGKLPPWLRRRWWGMIQQENLSVLMTPISLSNDIARGWLDINYFDLLVLDEGHHGVARDMYGWRINYQYSFLNGCNSPVVANTITTDCSRLRALKDKLRANEITDKRAVTQPVNTIIHKIKQDALITLDQEIGKRIRKLAKPIEDLTGIGLDESTKFFLIQKNIDEIAKKKRLSEGDKRLILSCWARIAELMVLKVCLQEDMLYDLKLRLMYFISKAQQPKYEDYLSKLYSLAEKCRPVKTQEIIQKTVELTKKGKLVLITTKRRMKAEEINDELNRKGIKAGALMGGLESPQLVLEEYLNHKFQVIVMTPVGIESLNLKEFDALIHVSPYSSKFTKDQIKGRIRGGEEHYFVYSETNDEKKLYHNEEEPEFDYLYWHYRKIKQEIRAYVIFKEDSYEVKDIVKDKEYTKKYRNKDFLIVPTTYTLSKFNDILKTPAYIGKFGEQIAKAYLNKDGFKIIRVYEYLNKNREILSEKEIKYLKSLNNFSIDYLCLKKDKKYLVEVKTTSVDFNDLSSWQAEKLKEGKELGYIPVKFNIFLRNDSIKINKEVIQ